MIQATAIIGGHYGDEGKGLATDFFASQNSNSIVVRFNGGAQAGHTVVTPDGRRHVFHHFGSGSFCDVPTYLSEYFIVNPVLWQSEMQELNTLGVRPKMFLNYLSPVSTPYDMLLNRAIETHRGAQAHGSVGVGIHETMLRTINGFSLLVEDLFDPSYIAIALDEISQRYVPQRLEELNMDPNIVNNWDRAKINKHFIEATNQMLATHDVALNILEFQKQHLIFEGAQGLGLDACFGTFPHVTPSRCGTYNIFQIFENLDNESIDLLLNIYYISRTYVTRHGNGPLEDESQELNSKLNDATNTPNPWQGKLRYAPLSEANLHLFQKRMTLDLDSFEPLLDTSRHNYFPFCNFFFTHHDEIPVAKHFHCKFLTHVSNGPTRNHVHSPSLILS